MGEKFKPRAFEIDPESGKMEPVPPKGSAEIKEEEEKLEEKERERTIRLNPDATFADFCRAVKEAGEGAENLLIAELWDHFDADEVTKLTRLMEKPPEEYTDEEKELAESKILDHFPKEDIEAYLPVEFREDKGCLTPTYTKL